MRRLQACHSWQIRPAGWDERKSILIGNGHCQADVVFKSVVERVFIQSALNKHTRIYDILCIYIYIYIYVSALGFSNLSGGAVPER